MLKGSWLSVTEDMSRRIRESRHSINDHDHHDIRDHHDNHLIICNIYFRQELRKFMRETKKTNPAAQCSLQGDKLYIDHKYYRLRSWSE